mmetsp:Transcript_7597/g.19482  ORF Transcript_7597/g.19482 Transcript_7597/m.19482 type:complete len:159 (-) Transcript_7597:72-548(-)
MKPSMTAALCAALIMLLTASSVSCDAATRKLLNQGYPQGPWYGGQSQNWNHQFKNDVKIEFKSPWGHEYSFEQNFEFGAGGSSASFGPGGGGAPPQPQPPQPNCSVGHCAQHMRLQHNSDYCGSHGRGKWQYFNDQGSAASCPGAQQGPISGKWLRCC